MTERMFEPWLTRWDLAVDGEPFATPAGVLLAVRRGSVPAMLKISSEAEERAGAHLMAWWQGEGAAPVLAHEDEALLMLRAQNAGSLAQMAKNGRDDEATCVLCDVAAQLHRPRDGTPPPLVPLTRWFRALLEGGERHGPFFALGAVVARELLSAPRHKAVLHGDIHHGNVLDFGAAGWLAIDPKGLLGERAFDYANMLCNPEGEDALIADRFERRIALIAETAGIERQRLLQWALAWSALSSVWRLDEGRPAVESSLQVGRLAAAALGIAE